MRTLILSALLLAAAPSFARQDCTSQPAALREAAATAEASKAKKAMYYVQVGEKLCAAGAPDEANRKFKVAAKTLGTEMASNKGAAGSAQ